MSDDTRFDPDALGLPITWQRDSWRRYALLRGDTLLHADDGVPLEFRHLRTRVELTRTPGEYPIEIRIPTNWDHATVSEFLKVNGWIK